MVSDKFRRELRQEAEKWRNEELIDGALYEQLADRYQFSELDTAARNRFITILLGLGSVLLGLGVITFVAANWQVWSRELKVALLLSAFIGFNAVGFYLWRRTHVGWQHRLGQGLLLLGALVLGANMALMSQMFHQSGLLYQLFIVWGLGVLGMAYSLQMTLLGILAILLMGVGYLLGLPEFLTVGEFPWLRLLLQHMPLLASILFIPLAYWCRSRWIFRLGAIVLIYSLEANLIRLDLLGAPAWISAIACALPPALLWAYDDTLWVKHLPRTESFNSTARTLAIVFLSLLFYFLSFYWLWNTPPPVVQAARETSPFFGSPLLDILLLGGFTLWQWLRRVRRIDLTTGVIASGIAIGAIVPYWHLSIDNLPVTAVAIFNILLFLLAAGLVREGLALEQRRLFWGGMVLFALQVLTRMMEYRTGLLFKSFVFALCGIGVVAAGLWFERYVRSFGNESAGSQN
jgi:uncharacterized membrane protein